MSKELKYFKYAHLNPELQAVSRPFHELAHDLVNKCPPNEQRSLALQKLIEAKDCAVRAMLKE